MSRLSIASRRKKRCPVWYSKSFICGSNTTTRPRQWASWRWVQLRFTAWKLRRPASPSTTPVGTASAIPPLHRLVQSAVIWLHELAGSCLEAHFYCVVVDVPFGAVRWRWPWPWSWSLVPWSHPWQLPNHRCKGHVFSPHLHASVSE